MIILLTLISLTLSFSQVHVSFESKGDFLNKSTGAGLAVGYNHNIWQQKNVSSGIGIETSIIPIKLNNAPRRMSFNTIYFHFKYAVEETLSAYTRLGATFGNDNEDLLPSTSGMYFGVGIDKNFDDQYHIQLGYQFKNILEYNYSSFVITFIKHFELEDDE